MKTRFTWVAAVLIAAQLASAAHAAGTSVTVVPHLDLTDAAKVGAVGLAIPAVGGSVSRAGALDSLRSGRLHNTLLGGLGDPVIAVGTSGASPGAAALQAAADAAATSGELRVFVVLPPDGPQPNDRRYPVVVIGRGFHGKLRSTSTRIPGLVTLADVAPTALAAEGRPIPDSVNGHVLSWRPASDAAGALEQLDARLNESRESREGGAIAYAAILIGLACGAIAFRSSYLGRAALLTLPAAATASLALALAGVSSWAPFAAATGVATLAGGAFLRRGLAIGLALAGVLLFYGVASGASGEALSFSLLGPNPGVGGRFFGLSNALETILLGTAVAAGALLWERLGTAALMIAGGLGVVVMAAGRAGASVTGAIVLAVAYCVLAIVLEGVLGLIPAAVVAGAAAFVLAFAGPPHLGGAGGGRLVDRIETSARLSVDSVQSGLLTFAVGLAPLVVLAVFFPRLRPRLDPTAAACVLALLVALLVSLFINDTPAAVLNNGAAWCLALVAYGLVRSDRVAADSSYRLAPVCAGAPFSRLRLRRSQ